MLLELFLAFGGFALCRLLVGFDLLIVLLVLLVFDSFDVGFVNCGL